MSVELVRYRLLGDLPYSLDFFCCVLDLDGQWRAAHFSDDIYQGRRPSLELARKLAESLGRHGHVIDKIARMGECKFKFFSPYETEDSPVETYPDGGSW